MIQRWCNIAAAVWGECFDMRMNGLQEAYRDDRCGAIPDRQGSQNAKTQRQVRENSGSSCSSRSMMKKRKEFALRLITKVPTQQKVVMQRWTDVSTTTYEGGGDIGAIRAPPHAYACGLFRTNPIAEDTPSCSSYYSSPKVTSPKPQTKADPAA